MPARVLIFTASIGAGHDLPAEVLAAALRERDASAEVVDGLAIAGPVARRIIGVASRVDSTAGNLAFNAGYVLVTKVGPLRRVASGALAQLTRRGFQSHLRSAAADVIVSTYPLWSDVLGRMRMSGALQTPVV
ncbi:MAG TPA: hypothetical protein VGV67_14810, partial [Solirubrobacteraceae bacterium]|nr:hypothetical protein [Solirubrobacteraceae bacterium]